MMKDKKNDENGFLSRSERNIVNERAKDYIQENELYKESVHFLRALRDYINATICLKTGEMNNWGRG